ncbi:MAG: cytochrome-c peroxidase [Spirochaetia bacterium]|nr:cytochrome-c peroxidase [Spirochaetia bacterium]
MDYVLRRAVLALFSGYWGLWGVACTIGSDAAVSPAALLVAAETLTPEQQLGREIFFDTDLSEPAGQSCGSCHSPLQAFTTPSGMMTHGITPGIVSGRTGSRNTPTASYAVFSPTPFFDDKAGTWIGGQFFDQRADSLEDQAGGPFLNAVEMANPSKSHVVQKLARARYASRMRSVYGTGVFTDTEGAYSAMTKAIAAYERSREVSPFTSKFDAYNRGLPVFTAQESRGLAIFRDPKRGNCESCHPSTGAAPLFTDFSNDNIGVPANPQNPFYTVSAVFNPDGASYVDKGLGASERVNDEAFNGRFKVPTLRNVNKTGPYMHNGFFQTLRDVIRFYNTACAAGNPDSWPAPEVSDTRNCSELGDLGLSNQDIDDLTAFLLTLDDGWVQR